MDFFKMFYTTLGGLGLFFIGMKYLSDSLQLVAGNLIKKLINYITSNRIMAVLVGMTITAIIQSSSVCTVMVVGMVNANLMNLTQAIGVILGSNIGTTITGWILAIKIGKYGLLFIGLGVFPMLFASNSKFSSIAKILVALGLVFFGLELMSGAFKPLRTDADFLSYMTYFNAESLISILGCVLAGCILTLLIQSSSAMLGITIALGSTGSITFQTAAALVLGENIGTTITAQLAAIGGGTNAKRAAVSHALFNIVGVSIIIFIFKPYIAFIDSLVPGDPNAISNAESIRPYMASHIACFHSIFNITATLIILPFVDTLHRISTFLVKSNKEETCGLKYIGKPDLVGPTITLNMAEQELFNMKNHIDEMLEYTKSYITKEGNSEKLHEKVVKLEEKTDELQEEITKFITHTIEWTLSLEQSEKSYSLIRSADELESIADYALSLCSYRKRLTRHGLELSEAEWKNLTKFCNNVFDFYIKVSSTLRGDYPEETVLSLTKQLNKNADDIRAEHLKEVNISGHSALSALTFSDMIVALRRIKNHSLNLYQALAPDFRKLRKEKERFQ